MDATDDDARYGAGLGAWLQHTGRLPAGAQVIALRRPTAGHASKTFLVTVSSDAEAAEGPNLVLRLPPDQPTHMGENLRLQAEVQELLARAGRPVPTPATYEPDEQWLGAPFVTMPCVAGHVAGEVPALDPWITDSSAALQQRMHEAFTDALADVHRLDWLALGAADHLPGAGGNLDGDINYWSNYLEWATDGRPVRQLVEALDRCRATRPTAEPQRSLIWGDARIGNAIFDDDREVRALIDWETARIGSPEFDVGWWLGLESVMEELLGRRVPGFLTAEESLLRYERRLGRALVQPDWFMTFAVVAAACYNVRLAVLKSGAAALDGIADNPLIALVERRTSQLA